MGWIMVQVVNVARHDCLTEEAIMPSSEMLAKIKHLAGASDPARVRPDVPAMQSREEVADFCDEYDRVIKGYRLLKQDYKQLNEDDKSLFQLLVILFQQP